MHTVISTIQTMIWNWPVTLLCLIGGIFFTLYMRFIQIRCFPHAISLLRGRYDNPEEEGQITHFQALCSALSATIGLGNIAGVAIAIAMAGPGSIFWMWIIGLFGMATKYIECTLGTHYRTVDCTTGKVHGGPMYYIEKGLGQAFKPLGQFYSIIICFAALGAGCLFQANQAASALANFNIPTLNTGLVLFALSFLVILGGIKRIGIVASKIVPFMCLIYIGCACLICILNYQSLPAAFSLIIRDAFTGYAVAGGFVPVLFAGIRRAIFSNEAGLGSAAIAHAAVKTDHPVREGIVASIGPFIDTLVVCTATAMVIILSGSYGSKLYIPTQAEESFEKTNGHPYTTAIVPLDRQNMLNQPFQSHATGSHILSVSTNSDTQSPLILRVKNINNQLVRFAYLNLGGAMSVAVYTNNTIHLGTFDSKNPQTFQGMAISLFTKKNHWESAIIKLTDPSISELTLHFIPQSAETKWFIDAVTPVKKLEGIDLTTRSFDTFFNGFGSIFITIAVLFFAFSTMITWSYYGETAIFYLFGEKTILPYRLLFTSTIIVGATQSLELVVNFSDAMTGLLVIPNMIALILLSGNVKKWTIAYYQKLKSGAIKPYK